MLRSAPSISISVSAVLELTAPLAVSAPGGVALAALRDVTTQGRRCIPAVVAHARMFARALACRRRRLSHMPNRRSTGCVQFIEFVGLGSLADQYQSVPRI